MKNYNLENRDYLQIEKIFSTTRSISELYRRLYKLELNGEVDSNEYEKTLDYLKIAVEVENKLYDEADLTADKCREWYNYIQFKELYIDKNLGIEGVLEQDYKNPAARRITATLATVKGEKEEIWNVTNGCFVGAQQVDVIKEIRNDIFFIFESLLKESQNEISGTNELNFDFLIAKYYVPFTFKTFEEYLLEKDFKIPDIPVSSSRFFVDITKIDPRIYKTINQKYPLGFFNDQYEKVMYLDYNNLDEVSASTWLRLKFMTAILTQMDFEIFNIVYVNVFNELHKTNFVDDKVINNLILQCLEDAKIERQKKKTIRLGTNSKINKK